MDENPRHFWKKLGETGSVPVSFTRNLANSQVSKASSPGIGRSGSNLSMSQHMIRPFPMFKLASEFGRKKRGTNELPGNDYEQVEISRYHPFGPASSLLLNSNGTSQ